MIKKQFGERGVGWGADMLYFSWPEHPDRVWREPSNKKMNEQLKSVRARQCCHLCVAPDYAPQ